MKNYCVSATARTICGSEKMTEFVFCVNFCMCIPNNSYSTFLCKVIADIFGQEKILNVLILY